MIVIEQIKYELTNHKSIIEKFNELDDIESKINREGDISNIDETLSLNWKTSFRNFDQYIEHLEELRES